MTKHESKPGRPPLGERKRTERLVVVVERDVRDGLAVKAEKADRTLSDYCRGVLVDHLARRRSRKK